jgi:hypothetical protein
MSLDDYVFKDTNDNKDSKDDYNKYQTNIFITIKDSRLPIPAYLYKNEYISKETKDNIYQYLTEMSPLERKAYLIAFHHLESSFHITKSNGFKEWLEKSK